MHPPHGAVLAREERGTHLGAGGGVLKIWVLALRGRVKVCCESRETGFCREGTQGGTDGGGERPTGIRVSSPKAWDLVQDTCPEGAPPP